MKYDITVSPRTRVFSYADRFANDVQHFSVLPDHDALTIVSRSQVVTVRSHAPPAPVGVDRAMIEDDPIYGSLYDMLAPSRYVEFAPPLEKLADEVLAPDDDLAVWFVAAGAHVHDGFTYDRAATTVSTTVGEAVEARAGVCQDFAHVLCALGRIRGIPTRYVSGYVFSGQPGSVLGAEASHAWSEAYLPPYGWIGYDPTNKKLINDEFVKIAVGRDYGDITPVRGVYKGRTPGALSVNVAMEALPNQ